MSTDSHLVMVVDDDDDIRDSLCAVLECEGYQVVSRRNGREALAYLRGGEAPCVILLDLMMPVMDGWTFRQEQRLDPELKEIPVVVITAGGKDQVAGLDAQRVLFKPLPLAEVLGVVGEYCADC